jgi:hypothetical protein
MATRAGWVAQVLKRCSLNAGLNCPLRKKSKNATHCQRIMPQIISSFWNCEVTLWGGNLKDTTNQVIKISQ